MKTKTKGKLPSEVFVAEVQAARQRRGWTQQDLADRLAALDIPMDRSTIGKIEAGKRGVTIDDLVHFAVALGVPPLSLLVTRSEDEDAGDGYVRVAPNQAVRSWQVLMWMRGHWPLMDHFRRDREEDDRFFYDSMPDIDAAARRHWPALGQAQQALAELTMHASLGDEATETVLRELTTLRSDLGDEIRRTQRKLAKVQAS